MPELPARINKLKQEIRCGLPDCGALLFKGIVTDAQIRIKCKCGVVNVVIAEVQHIPDSPVNNGKPFQDRMNLTRKAGR